MSTHATQSQRSTGRPDYILVGRDTHGAEHVYATWKETVYVIEGTEITHKIDLFKERKTVNNWIDHVKLTRGFEEQYLFKTMGDFATDRI